MKKNGCDKTTCMLLFDGSDGINPINRSAQTIMDLVQDCENSGYSKDLKLQSTCALIYSRTKSAIIINNGLKVQKMMESNPNLCFTHQQLYNIVNFFSNDAPKK